MVEAVTSEDTARWEAVQARVFQPEEPFVYAVRTTGVFCRPGCASRRPLRKNVEFFDSPGEAILKGYRPCRRCRPTGPAPHAELLSSACDMLARGATARSRDVAHALGLSPSYFQRVFKKHLGVTPQQYRRRALSDAGRSALLDAGSVTETVYAAGYSSSSRFYEGIGRELGMAPATALRGGAGETIRYMTTECSLGHVLIAWTPRGICDVALGDDTHGLRARLRKHYPAAQLEPFDDPTWASEVIEAVERGTDVGLPLDVRGTAFQERVWQALRAIPRGETRSYTELAETLGAPTATRAVASACGKNRLAVLVPCHRVLRKDGGISGYRWGMARKQLLLEREAESVEKG